MNIVHHEYYTWRDGRVEEIVLVKWKDTLHLEAWSRFNKEWSCRDPHQLTSDDIDKLMEEFKDERE